MTADAAAPLDAHFVPQGSARERVEAFLGRIERANDELCALITVLADQALAAAARCDEIAAGGGNLGPLHGTVVVLKDNIDVAGAPTTGGSAFFAGRIPTAHATVVERLRAAGAIVLAKANLAEFALGGTTQNAHYGTTRNPWDVTRVAGGSSGGSAAAVAAGLADAALGSDTGGSVRLPAAVTGLVGLRPTVGRVPNRGTIPLSPLFDAVGPMAHDAAGVARLLAAIEGHDPADETSIAGPADDAHIFSQLTHGIEGLRIGVPRAFFFDDLHPEVASAVEAAIEVLAALGAHVEEVSLEGAELAQAHTQVIVTADGAAYHASRLAEAPERLGPDVLVRLRRGQDASAVHYADALAFRRRWSHQVAGVLQRIDLLATPTVPVPASSVDGDPLEETARLLRLTNHWALAGLPAVSVPCGFAGGVPTGLQLAARPWHDGLLLRTAHAYQQATDWHTRRAPLLG